MNEPPAFLTVRELAQLLRVKERRIYALAQAGELPCSRLTGRLLFPKPEVEAWLARHEPGGMAVPSVTPCVLAGSHDPLLEWALRESRSFIASFFDGSLDGLRRLKQGEASVAGLHLPEADGTAWNRSHVVAELGERPVVLLEWAWRERGLIVPAGNPLGLRGLADLPGRRIAPRQSEAGAELLFRMLLVQADLPPTAVERTEPPARNETDAALAVAHGKADATFGLACVARQLQLDFIPLLRERFDLLLDRATYFEPPFQRFAAFCRGPALQEKAAEFGGYDIGGLFTVRYNAP